MKMTIDDILALSKAGFTAEQITRMMEVKEEATKPEPPKEEAPKPEVKEEAPKPEVKEEAPKQEPSKEDAILNAINNLTKSIQLGAIGSTNQPKVESAQDILAQIINPPKFES